MQQARVEVMQQGGLWVVEADVGEQPEQEQQPGQQREWRVGPFASHEAAAVVAQPMRSFLKSRGKGQDFVALLQQYGVGNVANSSAAAIAAEPAAASIPGAARAPCPAAAEQAAPGANLVISQPQQQQLSQDFEAATPSHGHAACVKFDKRSRGSHFPYEPRFKINFLQVSLPGCETIEQVWRAQLAAMPSNMHISLTMVVGTELLLSCPCIV